MIQQYLKISRQQQFGTATKNRGILLSYFSCLLFCKRPQQQLQCREKGPFEWTFIVFQPSLILYKTVFTKKEKKRKRKINKLNLNYWGWSVSGCGRITFPPIKKCSWSVGSHRETQEANKIEINEKCNVCASLVSSRLDLCGNNC